MSNGNQGIGSFLPSQYGTNLAAATQAQQENINQMMAASQADIPTVVPSDRSMSGMFGLHRESLPSWQQTEGFDRKSLTPYGTAIRDWGEEQFYRNIDVLNDPEYARYLGYEDRAGEGYNIAEDYANLPDIDRQTNYMDVMSVLNPSRMEGYTPRYQNFEDYLNVSPEEYQSQLLRETLGDLYAPGMDPSGLAQFYELETGSPLPTTVPEQYATNVVTSTPEIGWQAYGEQQAAELAAAEAAAAEEAANRPAPIWQTYQPQQPSYMSHQDVIESVYGPGGFPQGPQHGWAHQITPQNPLYGINQDQMELYYAVQQNPNLFQALDPGAQRSIQQWLPEDFGQGEFYNPSNIYGSGGIGSLLG